MSVVRGVWYATLDGKSGWFNPSFVLSDDERIAKLQRLSDEATPGPWIRRWESLDVQYMGGSDGLTAMRDIDFAVAACAFVRDMLDEIEEQADRTTPTFDHEPGASVAYVTPEQNEARPTRPFRIP